MYCYLYRIDDMYYYVFGIGLSIEYVGTSVRSSIDPYIFYISMRLKEGHENCDEICKLILSCHIMPLRVIKIYE